MSRPEGYRKALRLMRLAEKFRLPVFTFVDTPGAYPGIGAEERGQSEAIGRNIFEMAQLEVPIIVTIIGEGGSGGALALSVGDQVLMLQYSVYSVISPEGCASILWKTAERAPDAAEALGITAHRLKALGLIDKIVSEPVGGAHRDPKAMAAALKRALGRSAAPGRRPEAQGTAGPPLRAPAVLRPLHRHQGAMNDQRVAVAVSGGRDSMALLHCLGRAAREAGSVEVWALHVHHGLQPHADEWAAFVEAACTRWARRGMPLRYALQRLTGRRRAGRASKPGRGQGVMPRSPRWRVRPAATPSRWPITAATRPRRSCCRRCVAPVLPGWRRCRRAPSATASSGCGPGWLSRATPIEAYVRAPSHRAMSTTPAMPTAALRATACGCR